MTYRLCALASIATLAALATPSPVLAQNYQVGQRVMCQSSAGTIVRIDPRVGWDTPFYVVQLEGAPDGYVINCTVQMLKAGGVPPTAQRQSAPAPAQTGQRASAPQSGAGLCKKGAKLEGRWGTPWYEVTVLGPPDASGNCPVRFDGYGAMWDNSLSSDLLRPRGSGPVQRPTNRVADTPAATAQGRGTVPDGSYECVKILGDGQASSIGTLRVQGGRATLIGKPAGWTMTALYLGGTDPWGKRIAVYEFTTPTGRDRLDCTRP